MSTHIQVHGKMAGSIGAGKAKVPQTPAGLPPVPLPSLLAGPVSNIREVGARWEARQTERHPDTIASANTSAQGMGDYGPARPAADDAEMRALERSLYRTDAAAVERVMAKLNQLAWDMQRAGNIAASRAFWEARSMLNEEFAFHAGDA